MTQWDMASSDAPSEAGTSLCSAGNGDKAAEVSRPFHEDDCLAWQERMYWKGVRLGRRLKAQ